MFETLRAGGLLFRNICSSLSPPSSTLHGWSVLFYPPTLGVAVTFLGLWDDRGQLYQRFKMSNALGIALLAFVLSLWKERAWAGPVGPRRRTADLWSNRDYLSLTPQPGPHQSVPSDYVVWSFPDWEIHPSEISWLPVDPQMCELNKCTFSAAEIFVACYTKIVQISEANER